jgi:hypothetical protein
MTHSIPRTAIAAIAGAALLSLSLFGSVSAQVATLSSPEESPDPDSAIAADVEYADRDEALLAFAQCMRDHDIDIDDPVAGERGRILGGGGPGGDEGGLDRESEEFQLGFEACGSIMESARPDIDPEAEQERLETELALAQCFRDNGYPDYPDPVVSASGGLERGGQALQELGIDRRSEEFQETRSTCADQLGVEEFGRGPGAGFGGGSN